MATIHGMNLLVIAGIIAGAILAWRFQLLSGSGAGAAALLGSIIHLSAGIFWLLPPLLLFIPSSLVSQLPRFSGTEVRVDAARGARRDSIQVLANGVVAGSLALWYLVSPAAWIWYAYAGAFAAASADTWGTEIGTRFGRRTWMIAGGASVAPGTSGAVSIPGILATVVGSAIVAFPLFVFPSEGTLGNAFLLVFAGTTGALADSLAGALLQRHYRDAEGKCTEQASSSGVRNLPVSGVKGINNDVVNLFCTAVGAFLGFASTW